MHTYVYLGPKIVHERLVTFIFKDSNPTQMEYGLDLMLFGVICILPQILGKMRGILET